MKSKSPKRPRRKAVPAIPRHLIEQYVAGLDAVLRSQAASPPAPPAPVPAAPASAAAPIMWHFQHTHPQLPNSILNLCTVAPTIEEARAKAYLLAEAFTQNVIGFIRANLPPQLPQGR